MKSSGRRYFYGLRRICYWKYYHGWDLSWSCTECRMWKKPCRIKSVGLRVWSIRRRITALCKSSIPECFIRRSSVVRIWKSGKIWYSKVKSAKRRNSSDQCQISIRNLRIKMNHEPLIKQQPMEGYLKMLDDDEVNLRQPEPMPKMVNGHQLGVINEKQTSERPFSVPLNLKLSSSATANDDGPNNTIKRDSFIRQSLNTIRKSFRFKNQRKNNCTEEDFDRLRKSNLKDNNNNKNVQLKKLEHTISFSDECVTKKKPTKHSRNSSLGSYFSFR